MEFKVFNLGLAEFKYAWAFQRGIFNTVKTGTFQSALILCRHYPVITLGRLTKDKDVLVRKGMPIYQVERGGSATYHGPGQLTVYPIFNLSYLKKDIRWFLRQLEEITLDFLADFGIQGLIYDGKTGVWIKQKKIASIGIAVRNWITFHGLSINIKKNDLENFRKIKPCGMDIEMTSLETILDTTVLNVEDLRENLIAKFKAHFQYPILSPQYSIRNT